MTSIPIRKVIACVAVLLSCFSVTSTHAAMVDVLVLYIDDALNTNAGRDINARIVSYIEYSNQAYANSNVDMELRLVGAEQLNANYTYVNGGNLDALSRNSEVASLRRKYGADIVTLLNLRQNVQGGYICGIGYVPGGRSSTGQLWSSASSSAFSLVGINCGLSTFTHELGHNMSLGHSAAQNSGGGIWTWARGHGVSGTFSTIMAYPQAYGTRNQLQRFSNPQQSNCEGLRCGVDRNQNSAADAAENLNRLADQIAGFMPVVVDVDDDDSGSGGDNGGGDNGGGDNGGDDNGGDDNSGGGDNGGGDNGSDKPVCQKPAVDGNLIVNGEFNSLGSWSTLFNASSISQADLINPTCQDKALIVGSRTAYYGSAYQDLSGKMDIDTRYTLKAKFAVRGASRDDVKLALRLRDSSGTNYQYLEKISATSEELTDYSDTFTIDSSTTPDEIGIIFYGPQAGVDIIIDSVSLVGQKDDEPTDPEPDPTDDLLLDEQFELSANGWGGYFTTSLVFSRTASQGSYSLMSRYRRYWYSGPGMDVTGIFNAGTTYSVTTDAFVGSDSSGDQAVHIWVYYIDDEGGHWQNITKVDVSPNQWHTVEGRFVVNPTGSISMMRLHVLGPDSGNTLRIDNLMAEQD